MNYLGQSGALVTRWAADGADPTMSDCFEKRHPLPYGEVWPWLRTTSRLGVTGGGGSPSQGGASEWQPTADRGGTPPGSGRGCTSGNDGGSFGLRLSAFAVPSKL